VTALAFSANGDALVVAGQGEARIYRIANRRLDAAGSSIPGPTGNVRGVVCSPDGSLVITASDEGSAKIWDAKSGKLLGIRDPQGKPLTALALARDGNTLWLASEDGTIGAWDVHAEKRTLAELRAIAEHKDPWDLGPDDVIRRRR
jgi:WD40 repeat protein